VKGGAAYRYLTFPIPLEEGGEIWLGVLFTPPHAARKIREELLIEKNLKSTIDIPCMKQSETILFRLQLML